MKTKSCGVLLMNDFNEILVGHVTGQSFFDIPKGQLDNINETEVECAIRECYEETSILLNKENLKDLGEYNYNKKKNLYLFSTTIKKSDYQLDKLYCSSYFESELTKQKMLEIDFYIWLKLDDNTMKNALPKSLYSLLKKLLIEETVCKNSNLFKM